MAPPRGVRVRVDGRGRIVLPPGLRAGVFEAPGEVLVRRVRDGLLLSPVRRVDAVHVADDGLPVLDLDRPVTNAEVLAGLEADRRDD